MYSTRLWLHAPPGVLHHIFIWVNLWVFTRPLTPAEIFHLIIHKRSFLPAIPRFSIISWVGSAFCLVLQLWLRGTTRLEAILFFFIYNTRGYSLKKTPFRASPPRWLRAFLPWSQDHILAFFLSSRNQEREVNQTDALPLTPPQHTLGYFSGFSDYVSACMAKFWLSNF